AAFTAGGIHAPGLSQMVVYAMAATVLLGARAGVITAIACSLITLSMVAADNYNFLPAPTVHYTPLTVWLSYIFCLSLALLVIHLMSRSLRRAFEREKAELIGRQQAEDKLAIALAAGGIGVWELTPSTGELVWDDRMYDMYGVPRGAPVDY